MLNLSNNAHIFFIGIGGISTSSLAEILTNQGYLVSGSNNVENQMTEYLKNKGIQTYIGHNANNITDDISLVVYTAAISEDNEELVKAKQKNIQCIRRDKMLEEIMKLYQYPVGIAGTHGKTTTSSMVSEIFLSAKLKPTISVGGIIKSINSNTVVGDNKYFIAEACEYKDSFLALTPFSEIILNIDADHLDYFKDIEQIRASFKKFAKKIPATGTLVINNNISNINDFISDLKCNIITYGNATANVRAENISYDLNGLPTFDIIYNDTKITNISLKVPGYHNVSNSLAAAALALSFNIPTESIKTGIENFIGSERRLELKGEFNSIKVFDDYAHHPTEITASITSFKAMPHKKLWVVFQPHTYTRTKALLNQFGISLAQADNVIITDIYAAREQNTVNIFPSDLVSLIEEQNKNVCYIKSFNDIAKYLKQNCDKNDIIAIMGAGDVNKICSMLV